MFKFFSSGYRKSQKPTKETDALLPTDTGLQYTIDVKSPNDTAALPDRHYFAVPGASENIELAVNAVRDAVWTFLTLKGVDIFFQRTTDFLGQTVMQTLGPLPPMLLTYVIGIGIVAGLQKYKLSQAAKRKPHEEEGIDPDTKDWQENFDELKAQLKKEFDIIVKKGAVSVASADVAVPGWNGGQVLGIMLFSLCKPLKPYALFLASLFTGIEGLIQAITHVVLNPALIP